MGKKFQGTFDDRPLLLHHLFTIIINTFVKRSPREFRVKLATRVDRALGVTPLDHDARDATRTTSEQKKSATRVPWPDNSNY